MCLGGMLVSQSLQNGAKTLFRHIPERHNFCHLNILRHSNIKMVAYKLSKNGWVMPFFVIFRLAREKLLVTVALDHPVSSMDSSLASTEATFLELDESKSEKVAAVETREESNTILIILISYLHPCISQLHARWDGACVSR